LQLDASHGTVGRSLAARQEAIKCRAAFTEPAAWRRFHAWPAMSYDIYFLRREPGQSWEDAIEALEEEGGNGGAPSRPAQWDQVVAGVREVLGEVSVAEHPPNWEIDDPETAIQVSCYDGGWSMTVPYWWDGERTILSDFDWKSAPPARP
jgi:hypothetical protein